MKELDITWKDGIEDPNGYLFTLAKALGTAIKCSPYPEQAEEVVATSGFAFRMWAAGDLATEAISGWDFDCQKAWVENSGFLCEYVGRYWGEEEEEEAKREEAIVTIRSSIDRDIPAIAFDVGGAEWGLITGYDDENEVLNAVAITGDKIRIPYLLLGKFDIPILSVLTITGKSEKSPKDIWDGTLHMAISHMMGEESSDLISGLAVYETLIEFLGKEFENKLTWNIEYHINTYGALKYYAHLYFAMKNHTELSEIYQNVYEAWKSASELVTRKDISGEADRLQVIKFLQSALELEQKALVRMKEMVLFNGN